MIESATSAELGEGITEKRPNEARQKMRLPSPRREPKLNVKRMKSSLAVSVPPVTNLVQILSQWNSGDASAFLKPLKICSKEYRSADIKIARTFSNRKLIVSVYENLGDTRFRQVFNNCQNFIDKI